VRGADLQLHGDDAHAALVHRLSVGLECGACTAAARAVGAGGSSPHVHNAAALSAMRGRARPACSPACRLQADQLTLFDRSKDTAARRGGSAAAQAAARAEQGTPQASHLGHIP